MTARAVVALVALVALTLAGVGLAPASSAAETRDAGRWPFLAQSPWNYPMGSGARFQSASDAQTANLLDRRFPAWVNSGQYSHPVFRAKTTDPLTRIFDRSTGRTFSIRVPLIARAAGGADRHMHIIDPAGRWLDEMWDVTGSGTSRATGHHHRTDLRGGGLSGGVRAYGGSAVGGLIRDWEVKLGVIRHALAIALHPGQMRRGPVWPATREDGSNGYYGRNPMGTFVGIPPSVNVSSLGLTREGRMVARALQNYGAYVVDQSGSFVFYTSPSMENSQAVRNLRADVNKIRAQLRVITNNGPFSIGGPGSRRAPLAPPFG